VTAAAEELMRCLAVERSLAPAERRTRAADTSLDRAVDLLQQISDRRDQGRPVESLPAQLGHLVTDSWDWSAELTTRVLQFTQGLARARGGA
jgi:hypothetical protein